MSTLELPSDVANKILKMLKPKSRPFAVLIFEGCDGDDYVVKVREGVLTRQEEESFKLDGAGPSSHGDYVQGIIENGRNYLDDLVHLAFSLEFYFRADADRERWQKRESFEMIRDAVLEIA